MKLFGREIKLFERFKGGFLTSGSTSGSQRINPGELSWAGRCQYFDRMVQRHPLAKACINTIAGQVMAEGLFLVPRVDEKGEPYPRTSDAKAECDMLNERIGLDSTLMHDSVINMTKFGSCFWEKDLDTFDVRLIPQQELIEPAEKDALGNITLWRQGSFGNVTWRADEIVHFPWNVTSSSWPYGTSQLVGLETEFEILEQLESDIKEFEHKNAFPKEIWQVGDGNFIPTGTDIDAVKAKAKQWDPGDYLITSYPIEHKVGGVGDREVRNLNDILTFLKQQLVDGLMTPPVSFQYSSTYASSKEMMSQQRANLVVPIQRLIKRKLENEVYKPYLESLGYSVKYDVPRVSFEDAEAHKVDIADYYTKLVASKIMPPRFAAKELGVPLEMFDAWMKEEEEKQQKQFQQKMEQSQQSAQRAQAQQATGDKTSQKSEEVWEVRKKSLN